MKITVETHIKAPLEAVWQAWNSPEDIMRWNTASQDWHTTRAEVDLRTGGNFTSRMEAKDGSLGFDFSGTYTVVEPHQRIEYRMDDDREVVVEFEDNGGHVIVRETFDAEKQNSIDMQREGWQAILDNFARHVSQANVVQEHQK